MRAVVYKSPGEVGVADVPEPRIVESTDAIVRVTLTGICGSKAAPAAARVSAASALLDRGWGKAEQRHELNADIQITIRTLGSDDEPTVIDVTPPKIER